jgi:hypothetical protein
MIVVLTMPSSILPDAFVPAIVSPSFDNELETMPVVLLAFVFCIDAAPTPPAAESSEANSPLSIRVSDLVWLDLSPRPLEEVTADAYIASVALVAWAAVEFPYAVDLILVSRSPADWTVVASVLALFPRDPLDDPPEALVSTPSISSSW